MFVPFLGKRGYMADVTRHGTGAPSGVMETILYDAFQIFKDEGIEYGSLGVAPLAAWKMTALIRSKSCSASLTTT